MVQPITLLLKESLIKKELRHDLHMSEFLFCRLGSKYIGAKRIISSDGTIVVRSSLGITYYKLQVTLSMSTTLSLAFCLFHVSKQRNALDIVFRNYPNQSCKYLQEFLRPRRIFKSAVIVLHTLLPGFDFCLIYCFRINLRMGCCF